MICLRLIEIVLPILSIIGVGLLLGRFKELHLRSITELILLVTAPCLVFDSISRKSIVWFDFMAISLAAVVVVLGGALMTFTYLTLSGARLTELYLPVMFMNSGNLALPLCLLTFGEQGLRKGIIYYVTVSLLTYTLGIFIISRQHDPGEILKVPLIYAFIMGLLVSLLHYPLPKTIRTPISMLGSITIPLMLLSLGYRLSKIRMRNWKLATMGALLRIGGGFIFGLLMVNVLGLSGLTEKIVLMVSIMPSAVINFVLAERYQADSELVASIIFISTMISLITIPLFLTWALNNP